MIKSPWGRGTKANDESRAADDLSRKSKVMVQNAMIKKAQELLKDPRFMEYRKLYKDYHDVSMEDLMMLGEQDPLKYAFKVRQVIDTLKAYRLLISAIEDDASGQIQEDIK